MIDPENQAHRSRLSKSMAYWYNEHERYRLARRETIVNHAGSPHLLSSVGSYGSSYGGSYGSSSYHHGSTGGGRGHSGRGVWGNLMQLSALAHSLTLAYNEPRYKIVANVPEADPISSRLEAFLNRWTQLIDLGDTAREIALDSFFGFGIAYVANGLLPAPARKATQQKVGPMVCRVSQDNFIYDGTATTWDTMSFMGHFVDVPLDEARSFEPFLAYNPEKTVKLEEYHTGDANTDGQIHSHEGRLNNAQAMTRLVEVYLPGLSLLATWPATNSTTFSGVEGKPLWVRPYNGHHTGPYAVLSHLDVPDNIIPVTQAESTKELHFLFNELADRVANQAREAKSNPVFEIGSERDAERLEEADDRQPVGVSNIQKIGTYEKPGPSQSQTSYMLSALQMFKEFSGNLDDTLGLAPTASTATQSQLIRQSNGIRGAEARRRMDRVMELIARKLSHLALNDKTLRLPIRVKVGGSSFTLDQSWLPPEQLPRNPDADDYLVTIIPGSMAYRAPEDRLAAMNEATAQIFQAMQFASQGSPIDLEKFVELQASYRDLPELRDIYSGLLPDHAERKNAAEMGRLRDPNRGTQVRENVSSRTNSGGLTQTLSQVGDEAGGLNLGDAA